jgi:LDH2 family malate/lactate/ureidoglycolate dehydrogenase
VPEGLAWAVIDGEAALGQVGCTTAMRMAIAKANQSGVATVAIRYTGHIGAAGFYALLAAREGCLGIVTDNDMPSVAAPGSRGPVLGSNPLAWSAARRPADHRRQSLSGEGVARADGRPQGLRLRDPGRTALRGIERRLYRHAGRLLDARPAARAVAACRGVRGVRHPGDLRAHHAAQADGIVLPPDVREKLSAAAALLGMQSPV